jgi:hypothetical protein
MCKNDLTTSAEVFKGEGAVKDLDKSDDNLLETKWLSIVRLSKKVVELTAKINQLTEEVENL